MYGVARTLPASTFDPALRKGPPRERAASSALSSPQSSSVRRDRTGAVAAKAPSDHAAQAWNVLPPGQAGGVVFTKNSTDQIALYEGLTRLRDNVSDADLRRYFKRETLGLAPGENAVEGGAPAEGSDDHPRPVGGAARQGDDHGERRVRRRLGHRGGPPADHGAPARAGPHRRARRAGRERLRARALRAASSVRAPRPRRGSRSSSTLLPRAGGEGPAGDPDHRRVRRGDQRRVPARRALRSRRGRGTTSSRSGA